MKQTSKYAIVFLAGAIFATAGSAYGAEAIKTISAKLRPDIKVSVNGKQLDASAISYNNTTYLPLRKAAEAVGGKIELNGKDINIVTGKTIANPEATNENSGLESSNSTQSPTETYPIEGKILFEWVELYNNIKNTQNKQLSTDVVNGKSLVKYDSSKYYSIRNTDYYYDPENDKTYYTKDFLLQFLSSSDLEGLSTFRVNVKTNDVNPI